MYCQVTVGQLACVGVVTAGGMAGVFLTDSLLSILAASIVIAGFGLFRLWRGSRELRQQAKEE